MEEDNTVKVVMPKILAKNAFVAAREAAFGRADGTAESVDRTAWERACTDLRESFSPKNDALPTLLRDVKGHVNGDWSSAGTEKLLSYAKALPPSISALMSLDDVRATAASRDLVAAMCDVADGVKPSDGSSSSSVEHLRAQLASRADAWCCSNIFQALDCGVAGGSVRIPELDRIFGSHQVDAGQQAAVLRRELLQLRADLCASLRNTCSTASEAEGRASEWSRHTNIFDDGATTAAAAASASSILSSALPYSDFPRIGRKRPRSAIGKLESASGLLPPALSVLALQSRLMDDGAPDAEPSEDLAALAYFTESDVARAWPQKQQNVPSTARERLEAQATGTEDAPANCAGLKLPCSGSDNEDQPKQRISEARDPPASWANSLPLDLPSWERRLEVCISWLVRRPFLHWSRVVETLGLGSALGATLLTAPRQPNAAAHFYFADAQRHLLADKVLLRRAIGSGGGALGRVHEQRASELVAGFAHLLQLAFAGAAESCGMPERGGIQRFFSFGCGPLMPLLAQLWPSQQGAVPGGACCALLLERAAAAFRAARGAPSAAAAAWEGAAEENPWRPFAGPVARVMWWHMLGARQWMLLAMVVLFSPIQHRCKSGGASGSGLSGSSLVRGGGGGPEGGASATHKEAAVAQSREESSEEGSFQAELAQFVAFHASPLSAARRQAVAASLLHVAQQFREGRTFQQVVNAATEPASGHFLASNRLALEVGVAWLLSRHCASDRSQQGREAIAATLDALAGCPCSARGAEEGSSTSAERCCEFAREPPCQEGRKSTWARLPRLLTLLSTALWLAAAIAPRSDTKQAQHLREFVANVRLWLGSVAERARGDAEALGLGAVEAADTDNLRAAVADLEDHCTRLQGEAAALEARGTSRPWSWCCFNGCA